MADDTVAAALSKLYVRWNRVVTPYAYARSMVILAAIDETRRPWRREQAASHLPPDRPEPDRLGAWPACALGTEPEPRIRTTARGETRS